jgi:hypothetical protein
MGQRGKKVVSANSGKATMSQLKDFASFINSMSRFTVEARLSWREMGPICAAPTVRNRLMRFYLPFKRSFPFLH